MAYVLLLRVPRRQAALFYRENRFVGFICSFTSW